MRRATIVLCAALGVSLVFAGGALEATHAGQVILCQIQEDGRTNTLSVSEQAATRLEKQGAWEGACQLERAAKLEGRVTDLAGSPLRGVCVNVLSNDSAANVTTTTGKSGSYRIYVPFPGEARLLFNDLNAARQFEPAENFDACARAANLEFVPEYYDDVGAIGKPPFSDADPVAVAEGVRVVGLDAALARFGTISGRVTNQATGQPVAAGVCIVGDTLHVEDADTGSDGSYTLKAVPGSHRLLFGSARCTPTRNSDYLEEWYNDKPDLESADTITVGDGQTVSGINAALIRGGSISGVVTDAISGEPIFFPIIEIYDHSTREFVRFSDGSFDGSYSSGALATGLYDIAFVGLGYAVEWYDDQPDQATATPVSVVFGQDTPGINAELTPEG